MEISSINGANAQVRQMGINQATDSYSRNIQNQIANAQKQLQELSSNKDMTQEEKMTKRQELQQQISDLNMQLRQHQTEQRREKQQKQSSYDWRKPENRRSRYGSDYFPFNDKRANCRHEESADRLAGEIAYCSNGGGKSRLAGKD